MKTGEALFGTGDLDRRYFVTLTTGQRSANYLLNRLMSQIRNNEIKDIEKRERFERLAVIALETIGAGDKTDKDYVEVSEQSLAEVCLQEKFNLEAIRPENTHFAYIIEAANYHVEEINKLFNDFYKTKIDTEEIWSFMGPLFSAYYLETKKSKKQV